MTEKKPILITGSHRSGTTWMGKMVAASPEIYYIQEPFNVTYPPRPGISPIRMQYWFTSVSEENGDTYSTDLRNTLACRYQFWSECATIRTPKDIARLARDASYVSYCRIKRKRPLMKDPIALFAAQWLAKTFDMQVIVMIRHPAAFASSLLRLNWQHDFSHFLQQPRLMEEHLAPFAAEIADFVDHEHSILEQSALLWRIIHYRISQYKRQQSEWLFLRHEDVSIDPLHHFEYIYKRLGLDFSPRVRSVIDDYSNTSNPSEAKEKHSPLFEKRDSKANSNAWKRKFTEAEIAWLHAHVEDVAQEFYTESDW